MIKTWLRKDRERIKRAHGSNSKPPKKYTDGQWDNIKKYWNLEDMIQKSEKMSDTRKKVNYNPKVGRRGYASKEVVLENKVTDVTNEILNAQDNPDSNDMQRKYSSRLTAVERQHADTNRRLDDVIKSNVAMQTMLKEVLTTVSSFRGLGTVNLPTAGAPCVGKTISTKNRPELGEGAPTRIGGSSEEWWDRLEKSSDVGVRGEKKRDDNKLKDPVITVSDVNKNMEDIHIVSENTKKFNNQHLLVGDWVRLADKSDVNITVGTGQASGLGDSGMFHNRPIPFQHIRVNINTVALNVPLCVPVEEAEQYTLEDAMGSSVLWPRRLTFRKI
ncbi:hypothetical protein KC19_VG170400 [Ceratodon purpureus]|uniref:DUF8039 domain-containing protein n=1 Tax=Ceratodon purpureus TaxID=3225 RepID=A0A8T0HRC5_CERPU|nr:hypothetical protein KC19_VG170400 [Ceratodon purpureus]